MKANITKEKLWRLYTRAANALLKPKSGLVACERYGATETDSGGEGIQVSVRVYRFSKKLLKKDKSTGGLYIDSGRGGKVA